MPSNTYDQAILSVFFRFYQEGSDYFVFQKDDLIAAYTELGLVVRNVPDIIYTYRSRRSLPEQIRALGHWAIESAGTNAYAFRRLEKTPHFQITFDDFAPIDIFNAVPSVVEAFLRHDEQSLLTLLLYNRLVDVFLGLTCFLIQNHYRGHVRELGQVELDALYAGVNADGTLYIIPIEAKSVGDGEMIGRIQISQMARLVRQAFPTQQRRLVAVKILADSTVALVEFSDHDVPDDIHILQVKRYRFVRLERA